jgi:hypothetical protein
VGCVGITVGFSDKTRLRVSLEVKECKPLPLPGAGRSTRRRRCGAAWNIPRSRSAASTASRRSSISGPSSQEGH